MQEPVRWWWCVVFVFVIVTAESAHSGEDFPSLKLPPFTVGVCTHFRDRHAGGLQEQAMQMMKHAGILSSRDEAAWNSCEKTKGTLEMPAFYDRYVNDMKAFGLQPLNILLYANRNYDNGDYPRSPEAVAGYVRYSEFVVNTLKERCRLYQVWNEWDGGCGMPGQLKGTGDPASYIKLLAATYPAIKKANPAAVVISNSVCTGDKYLEDTLKLGLLNHCDIVSLHTYNYGKADGGNPEAWAERMRKIDQMLRQYGGGKEVPLMITEMGWPTQIDARGTTPELSASYLARLYLLARTLPYIKGIWWYDYEDDGHDSRYNENNFGMLQYGDLTPKPSYFALAGVSGLVTGADFVRRLDAGDPDVWVLQYRYRDGRDAIAVWSAHEEDRWQVTFENTSAVVKPVQLKRVGNAAFERRWEKMLPGAPETGGSFLRLTVADRPWIIEGDLTGVMVRGKVQRFEFPESKRPTSALLLLPEAVAIATPYQSAGKAIADDASMTKFGKARNYRHVVEGTPYSQNDLDAAFRVRYERQMLYVDVTVTDDVFSQNNDGEDTWKGDGLQLACKFADRNGTLSKRFTEIDVALVNGQPRIYRRCGETGVVPGELTGAVAQIKQDGNRTIYTLALPAKEMGLPALVPGTVIGFSLLVNDNDGKVREGYLHWGDGIGHSKDPVQYNLVMMGE